jgi:hypothetical protein
VCKFGEEGKYEGGFQFSQQKAESWKKMVKSVKGTKFPLLSQQKF